MAPVAINTLCNLPKLLSNRHAGQVYDGPELAANVAQFRNTLRDPPTRTTYEALEEGRRRNRNPSLSFYQDSHSRRLSTPKRQVIEKFEQTVERFRRTSK